MPLSAHAQNGIGAIALQTPSVMNVHGDRISTAEVGQQIIIETTFYNNQDQPQPFLILFEVRDYRDDTTQYLAWQSSVLEPQGNMTIGSLWSPHAIGQMCNIRKPTKSTPKLK